MLDVFYIFLMIIVLFFVILIIKNFIKKEFCAICVAVSLVWIFLLVLNKIGLFDNLILIALLAGESVLGVFYLVEKKVSVDFKFFRLPFLLSLIFTAYSLLIAVDLSVLKLLSVLWLFFWVIFLYRKNEKINYFVNKVI